MFKSKNKTIQVQNIYVCANVDYADNSEDLESEHENLDYNANSNWVQKLAANVIITKSSKGQYHDNLYYCKDDAEMYMKIFSSIVLWSNVMGPIFESSTAVATSSDVESYFKTLKTAIFGRNMHRADEFIETHVEFVNAGIKLNAVSDNIGLSILKKRNRSNSLHDRPSILPGK